MKIYRLLKNVRFYILIFSFILSLAYAIYINNSFPDGIRIIKITQTYALTAAGFLYMALLAGPFCYNFKTPLNALYLKARRAIGVSAFYFAVLHASYGFLGELGGFTSLSSLDLKYLIAITLSFSGLIILSLMAATSFDFMVKFMTFKKWKLLHRFVYLASFFILVHALLIGEHFRNLSNPISVGSIIPILFLIFLEGKRVVSNLITAISKSNT